MFNSVTLVGNLSTDITMRQAGEQTTGSFKLAVNRPGKDKGADFVWVKTWNGTADACKKFIGKGSRVLVNGSIRTNRVENSDGSYTEYVEVNARSVQFLDSKRDSDAPEAVETTAPEPQAEPEAPASDDIPF